MGLAKLKCKKCGDIIESMSHYDFRKCSCGACAVDGGDDYFRCLANEGDYEIITHNDGTEYHDVENLSITKEVMGDSLSLLSEREKKIIRLHFGLDDETPRNLDEIAREFNTTRERIRQIEAKALRKIHIRPKRKKRLKDYLAD